MKKENPWSILFDMSEDKKKKRIIIGLFAHVDAGKTTLAERLLFMNGAVKQFGRVDSGEAFLDHEEMERSRGITVVSKQARFSMRETGFILVDTPGHSDLTPETERVLTIIDTAVLIVSASEGITSHTRKLWNLLKEYEIPVFFFINKTDMPGAAFEETFQEIRESLSGSAVCYDEKDLSSFLEEAALSDEKLLEQYLEGRIPEEEEIRQLVGKRVMFPVCAGSALTGDGTEAFMECLSKYASAPVYGSDFGARIYKISRDAKGTRLLWMKVTGGSLKVKDLLGENEKVDEIRIYSGSGYQQVQEVFAGDLCAVTGPSGFSAGSACGADTSLFRMTTVPVLEYDVVLSDLSRSKELEKALERCAEQEPVLMPQRTSENGRITIHVTGPIQLDLLKNELSGQFGADLSFREREVVYRETIADRVIGVGHFEPLKHYAEVHVLLEPAVKGSGIQIGNLCSRDDLEPHWQKLILSHLEEKRFKGVLTGSELTDVKITLLRGRAHQKHTESGDFRQAVFRAVRQGLMQAESILLEPMLSFVLEIPEKNIGRALSDLLSFSAKTEPPETGTRSAVITGVCPASEIRNYQKEVSSYTSGTGELTLSFSGYAPCHNAPDVIERIGYDPERDTDEPSSSVFCSHGAGIIVPWYEAAERMHLSDDYGFDNDESYDEEDYYDRMPVPEKKKAEELSFAEREKAFAAGEQELKDIFQRTYRKPEAQAPKYRKRKVKITDPYAGSGTAKKRPAVRAPGELLIVDGYNMIFAWDNLKKLASDNIDSARDALMDLLSDYQGTRAGELLLVFDAYRVPGMQKEDLVYHNIRVVYTREGETADKYIERVVNEQASKRNIRVATSDRLEQTMILGNGAVRMSAAELKKETESVRHEILSDYSDKDLPERVRLSDAVSQEVRETLKNWKD